MNKISPLSHGLLRTVFYDLEPQNEIAYFKAQANYTEIKLASGRRKVSAYSLKFFNDRIEGDRYIRVNRSYLVNRAFVSRIIENKPDYFISLKTGEEIKVPRRKRLSFLKTFCLKSTSSI